MNNTSEENTIKQAYNTLFDKDENGKAPDEDTFLKRLISLESAGKTKLFRTLLGDKTKEEVKAYLQTKSREDREKIVGKEYLGKEMTISKVINEYSEMVKNLFKKKPIKKALKEQGIECKKVDGMILPPEGQQRLIPRDSKGGEDSEEKKALKFIQYQEKCPVLFGEILTIENGIYPGDIVFFEGANEENTLRYSGYVAVQIPKLKKTIFINDMKGEATFVCDKLVSKEDMKKSKKALLEELGSFFHSVKYSENKKGLWKLTMIDLIFGPEQGSKKFVKDSLVDGYGNLTEAGKEWLSSKANYRRNLKIGDMSYVDIARLFGFTEPKANSFELFADETFSKLNDRIFGDKKAEYENQIITEKQNKIRAILEDENGLTELGRKRFNSMAKYRWKLKIGDMGYVDIVRLFGFTNLKSKSFDLYADETFSKLNDRIFGDKKAEYEKQLNKEKQDEIRAILENENGLTEIGREWFSLDTDSCRSFKLPDPVGKTYIDIAKIFGFTRADKLYANETISKLTYAIFGDKKAEYEKQLDTEKQDEIKAILENENGLTELGKEWFNSTVVSRRYLKLNGIGYIAVARIFGFTEKNTNNLFKDDYFSKLTYAIFGDKKAEYEKQLNTEKQDEIRAILEDENGLTEIGREWFSLDANSRKIFKLPYPDGRTYVNIARIFGLTETKKDIYRNSTFLKLSKSIFGKDKKYENELQQLRKRLNLK